MPLYYKTTPHEQINEVVVGPPTFIGRKVEFPKTEIMNN